MVNNTKESRVYLHVDVCLGLLCKLLVCLTYKTTHNDLTETVYFLLLQSVGGGGASQRHVGANAAAFNIKLYATTNSIAIAILVGQVTQCRINSSSKLIL